mmetsp:Transcript_4999/g.7530  ORF Transcript_4999/g.7530 Transcript_4999/m.7530 type:complete len:566 (+) Transcript_4999:58-1755(+)
MEGILGKQVKSILSLNTEDPSISQAFKSLPSISDSYPPTSDLKSLLKKRNLHIYKAFVNDLGNLVGEAQELHQANSELLERLQKLSKEINFCVEQCSEAVQEGKKLSEDQELLSQKQQVVESVLDNLKLTKSEISALNSCELDSEFFEALKKLQTIYQTSLLLDTNETRLLKLSLDDYLSQVQEVAYEKLFRFVQQQCKVLQQDKVELLPRFHEAISHLRQRPVYYNHCRKEIVRSRQNYFFKKFKQTVTEGEIPLQNHLKSGPLFVGECLAWVYENLVSEKDLIVGLIGQNESIAVEAQNLQESYVLDLVSDGVADEVQDYLSKAIKNCSMLESFQVLRVIDFYIQNLTNEVLSFASKLVVGLYKSITNSEKKLANQVSSAVNYVKLFSISTDLQVPKAFTEHFEEYLEIMRILNENEKLLEYYECLNKDFVEECLEFYRKEAEATLHTQSVCVLMLNVLHHVKFGLSEFEFCINELQKFDQEINHYQKTLVDKEVHRVIEEHKLKEEHLPKCIEGFYEEIYSSGRLEVPSIDSIKNQNTQNYVRQQIYNRVFGTYKELVAKNT